MKFWVVLGLGGEGPAEKWRPFSVFRAVVWLGNMMALTHPSGMTGY